MKQKLFTLFLALAASVGTIFASDTEVDGIWYDFDDEKLTATVTYKGETIEEKDKEAYSGDIIIPEFVTFNGKEYVVNKIGVQAFAESNITGIELPNTILGIGQYAFGNCVNLAAITIPQSVTSIAIVAFKESGIYNNAANWENDVLYIDDCLICVKPNTYLEGAYTIKDGTRLLADYALIGQYLLTEITIPESVEYIGELALQDCSGLTSLTISDKVREIRKQVFFGCRNLESITMSDAITSIEEAAFAYCWKLNISVLPKHVRYIGKQAFSQCYAMPGLVLPDSLRTIGERAFESCSGIGGEVIIPDSVTTIGDYAFEGCSKIKEVTIGESVKTCKEAFTYCTKLKTLHFNARHIEESQFSLGYNDIKKQITTLTFGEKVEYLSKQIFWGYSGITEVTLSNSIREIGASAFADCTNLKNIILPAQLREIGDYAFSKCGLIAISIPTDVDVFGNAPFLNCEQLTQIEWNAKHCSQTPINNSPFLSCDNIETVIFGEGVEIIPDWLCSHLQKLTTVLFPSTLTSIGKSAFHFCTALTDLTLPASVKSIGNLAFYNVENILQMHVYATIPPDIQNSTFENKLKKYYNNIPVYVPSKSYEAYINHSIWKDFNIIGSTEMDTAIDAELSTVNSQLSTKFVRDGHLYILRDGKTYTVTGAEVR